MHNLTRRLALLLLGALCMLMLAACDIFVQDKPDTVVVTDSPASPDVVVVDGTSPPPPPDININVEGDTNPPPPPVDPPADPPAPPPGG